MRQTEDRRAFLRALGLGSAALCAPGFLAACSGSGSDPMSPTASHGLAGNDSAAASVTLDFSTDFGVLNYAYALEQLEAAFYDKVYHAIPASFTGSERYVISDIRIHELIHEAFFKFALGSHAIIALTPNFSAIDFSSADSILTTAKTFEDLGVAAYNGAAKYLRSAAYLTLAGKIVSVEARHASAIREILAPRSRAFAGDDVIDAHGLDRALDPAVVLESAGPFIVNPITITNLPSSMA